MLACEKGTVFVFLPEGEKWNIKESSDAPVSQEHSTIKRDVLSGSTVSRSQQLTICTSSGNVTLGPPTIVSCFVVFKLECSALKNQKQLGVCYKIKKQHFLHF